MGAPRPRFYIGRNELTIDVEALISSAKKAFEQAEPDDIRILMGEEEVTVRIWPVTGQEWRRLTATYPARIGEDADGASAVIQADRAFSYNVDALTREYPRVALVDDGTEKNLDTKLWGRILDVLDGPAFEGVAAVIFYLNVVMPAKRQAAAGKARRGEQAKKRRSPGNSASPSES